nr:MAG TPA: hypothetical protein [Caudoviricetes sp.]
MILILLTFIFFASASVQSRHSLPLYRGGSPVQQ